MDKALVAGNAYLVKLEDEIIDMIRRNDYKEGEKLVALINERENIKSRLYELNKNE
jgi:hypothetical protein